MKAGLWVRPLTPPVGRADRLLIAVEGGRYGWSAQLGGQFRVLLGAGAASYAWPGLTSDQRRAARLLSHSVIDKLDPYYAEPIATMRHLVDHPGHGELWFPFLDEDDVRQWFVVLSGWLPASLASLAGDDGIQRVFSTSRVVAQ